MEIVAPEGNFIRKEEITEINLHAVYRPYEARAKVYIFLEADSFNIEAANAFLKTLEEPPGHVHFILVTDRPERLLPTIVSRCQPVAFSPVPAAGARPPTCTSGAGCPRPRRSSSPGWPEGNLSYARELATSESARRQRDLLLDLARDLPGPGLLDTEVALDEVMATVEAARPRAGAELEAELKRALEWAGDARTRKLAGEAHEEKIKRQQRRLRHAGPAEPSPGCSPAGTGTWPGVGGRGGGGAQPGPPRASCGRRLCPERLLAYTQAVGAVQKAARAAPV